MTKQYYEDRIYPAAEIGSQGRNLTEEEISVWRLWKSGAHLDRRQRYVLEKFIEERMTLVATDEGPGTPVVINNVINNHQPPPRRTVLVRPMPEPRSYGSGSTSGTLALIGLTAVLGMVALGIALFALLEYLYKVIVEILAVINANAPISYIAISGSVITVAVIIFKIYQYANHEEEEYV